MRAGAEHMLGSLLDRVRRQLSPERSAFGIHPICSPIFEDEFVPGTPLELSDVNRLGDRRPSSELAHAGQCCRLADADARPAHVPSAHPPRLSWSGVVSDAE